MYGSEVDDEDAGALLDELEGRGSDPTPGTTQRGSNEKARLRAKERKKWLPEGMEPVLEELPKWSLLVDILQEIEDTMVQLQTSTSFRMF